MANIRIFGYTNKSGVDSWKVVLIVGETDTYFGGISLGKALLSEHATSSFEDIIESGVAFETLDHLPRRGEGLTQYNDCYKMFSKSGVTYTLAEIPAEKILDDIDGFKKAVSALKQAEPKAVEQTVKTKTPSDDVSSDVVGALVFIGGISDSSNASELVSLGSSEFGGGYSSVDTGSGYVTDSASGDDVANALKTIARALGYNITIN